MCEWEGHGVKEQHLQRTEEHMCLLTSLDAEARRAQGALEGQEQRLESRQRESFPAFVSESQPCCSVRFCPSNLFVIAQ